MFIMTERADWVFLSKVFPDVSIQKYVFLSFGLDFKCSRSKLKHDFEFDSLTFVITVNNILINTYILLK